MSMQNTIFDLPHNWRERVPIYPGDSNRRIGRKNENVNPVRVVYICSSIITLIFGFFMTKTGQKGFFILLFPREFQGIKWKMIIS